MTPSRPSRLKTWRNCTTRSPMPRRVSAIPRRCARPPSGWTACVRICGKGLAKANGPSRLPARAVTRNEVRGGQQCSPEVVLPEPDAAKAIRIRDKFAQGLHQLLSPDIFPVEVAHILTKSERRGILQPGEGVKK